MSPPSVSSQAFINRRTCLRQLPGLLVGSWLLACGGAGPSAQFGRGLVPAAPSSPVITQLERGMFALLNRDRKAEGLGPLKYDEDLAAIARYQSADMRDHKFFDHISPTSGSPDDRLDAAGYLFLTVRENLSEAPDIETSQAGLMLSPHHHENIMAQDVTHVGIGIVKGGVQDPRNLTFTQVFARPAQQQTQSEVHSALHSMLTRARRQSSLGPLKQDAQLTELAERHIAEVDPQDFDASVARVGNLIPPELSSTPIKGVAAVLVGGQLLPDSSGFVPPDPVLGARASSVGIAVRRVTGPKQRPTWCVLLIVGLKE